MSTPCRELSEVRKASAVTQSVAQEAALSAEQTARVELTSVLGQSKLEAQREKESLLMQVCVCVYACVCVCVCVVYVCDVLCAWAV